MGIKNRLILVFLLIFNIGYSIIIFEGVFMTEEKRGLAFIKAMNAAALSDITAIISEKEIEAQKKQLDAIKTLALVNNGLKKWLATVSTIYKVDEKIIQEIAELKKPLVVKAKETISANINDIIRNNNVDVAEKISEYMDQLADLGIDLNEDNRGKAERKESRGGRRKAISTDGDNCGCSIAGGCGC